MPTLPTWGCLSAHQAPEFCFRPFRGLPMAFWPLKALLSLQDTRQLVICCSLADREQWAGFLDDPAIRRRLPEGAAPILAGRDEAEALRYAFDQEHPLAHYLYLSAVAPLIHKSQLLEALEQLEGSELTAICAAHQVKAPLWSGNTPLIHSSGQELWMPSDAFWCSTRPVELRPNQRLFFPIPKTSSPIYDEPAYAAASTAAAVDAAAVDTAKPTLSVLDEFAHANDIQLFLTDVDGVMSDGGMYYTEEGEFKRFHVHDGMALQQLQASGIKTGIITSENTEIVTRRAAKLRVDYLSQGKRGGGKLDVAKDICQKEGITLKEVAYIGDDVNCLPLLKEVGIAACPSDAATQVRALPGIWVLGKAAGQGVVREFIEKLFPELIK